MAPEPGLTWPDCYTDGLGAAVHRLVYDVSALGGAIGWLEPPPRRETDGWLRSLLRAVHAGDAALCLATVDGVDQAMGCWRREGAAVFRHCAVVAKVMAHPEARGLGLGRLVVGALVERARQAGIETLHLGVRGNNHLAIALYQDAGFREWGRLPDAIAVGNLRYDDVRMYLQLPRAAGVRLRGSAPEGPGSSPAPR